jgi:hypothetical protein
MRRRYIALWVAGIVAGTVLRVSWWPLISGLGTLRDRIWSEADAAAGPPPFPAVLLDEWIRALAAFGSFGVFAPAVRWLAIWTVIVLVLAIRDHVRPNQQGTPTSRRVDFLLIWLIGGFVIANWGLALVGSTVPLALGPAELFAAPDQRAVLLALLILWTAGAFLLFLFIGDDDAEGFHAASLAPYRSVLAALALVVLFTILANVFVYRGVQSRVRGLEAVEALAGNTVEALHQTAVELSIGAERLDPAGDLRVGPVTIPAGLPFEQFLPTQQLPPVAVGEDTSIAIAPESEEGQRIVAAGPRIAALARETRGLACAALLQIRVANYGERAEPGVGCAGGATAPEPDSQDTGIVEVDRPSAGMLGVENVLELAVGASANLDLAADGVDQAVTTLEDGEALPPSALRDDVTRLADLGQAIAAHAEVATDSLAALQYRGMSIVLWLSAFYSSFILLPWVLLLMFLYRKRRARAQEIIADLDRLDPSGGLLLRAVGTRQLPANPAEAERLLERAFGTREYLLALSLLTALTAAGWFYFLYPQGGNGLATLVQQESGIVQLVGSLTGNVSPLTMGFAGAYLFVSFNLIRRYLSGDLYPSAFLGGAVRIVEVFTISVVLAVLLPALSVPASAQVGVIVAFMAGIFPREGLRLIAKGANGLLERITPERAFPEAIDEAPLTDLGGINIFVEARLLEENVENVQGMATAPIEQLVVGTFYPAVRIVDWIDQAILHCHCGTREQNWCADLRRVGIRTATDLLDAAAQDTVQPWTVERAAFWPTDAGLAAIAKSVECASPKANGDPKADGEQMLTPEILGQMCRAIWPAPNLEYVLQFSATVPIDEETGEPTAALSPRKRRLRPARLAGDDAEQSDPVPVGQPSAGEPARLPRTRARRDCTPEAAAEPPRETAAVDDAETGVTVIEADPIGNGQVREVNPAR